MCMGFFLSGIFVFLVLSSVLISGCATSPNGQSSVTPFGSQHAWIKENLEKFYKFFYEKVNNLDDEEFEEPTSP